MSERMLQPGDRFKFPDFDKTYRVLDWQSLSNLLEVVYGPFHIRLVSGKLELLDQLQQGFAVEEQSGVLLALEGTRRSRCLMSDKAFPLVLKDLKIMAIILNEDGTEVPLQVEVPRVVAASFSTNRQVTRVWGEDGRVCGATLPSWRHGHE